MSPDVGAIVSEPRAELPIVVPVLDKGYLQLEAIMGGDAAVVRGARICYGSEARSPEADVRLIRRLMAAEPKHNTVFEHAVLRLGVKCPIFVARQWLRHRICSFNERSLRYCVADREYYVPVSGTGSEDTGSEDTGSEDAGSEGVAARDAYVAHMEASFDLYERLLAAGWPPERARGVLGTAIYTEFIWTVNAWSFMNWLYKRLDQAAQWEHRQYAEAALGIYRQVMPVTAEAFVASILRQTQV